ncbi:hypothetical protein ECNE037_3211, partial [Escherichia coli NE037]
MLLHNLLLLAFRR